MYKFYFFSILFFIFSVNSFSQRGIDFGTDTTFEIATWNLEHFPKNGQTTVDYVSLFMQEMSIDLYALEEIESQSSFNTLVEDLEGYEGYWAYDSYAPLALIYKSGLVELQNTYRILTSYSRELPRAPLVAEISVRGDSYIVIVNHYKCCGDGVINQSDDWDEETRRYDASVLLKNYIDSHYADDKVIMLGDFNDEILDEEANNVFQPFLDASTDYAFADLSIAQSSALNWSYPSWPSHLDHILVTNEVFEEFTDGVADVECLKPDSYLPGGWATYDSEITDHRPVALKLSMDPDTVGVSYVDNSDFHIYPNPATNKVNILTQASQGVITIYNSIGNILDEIKMEGSQMTYDLTQLEQGFYFVNIRTKEFSETKRLIIER